MQQHRNVTGLAVVPFALLRRRKPDLVITCQYESEFWTHVALNVCFGSDGTYSPYCAAAESGLNLPDAPLRSSHDYH